MALALDFKTDTKVVIRDLAPSTKFQIGYELLTAQTRFSVDRCGTIVIKSKYLKYGNRFGKAEQFDIEGDDKTTRSVTVPRSAMLANQNSVDWNSVESTKLNYKCVNSIIGTNLDSHWIEYGGLKFHRRGLPNSPGEKLYITGFTNSTVRLRSPQDKNTGNIKRIISSDKCGQLVIKENTQFPHSGLGNFGLFQNLGSTGYLGLRTISYDGLPTNLTESTRCSAGKYVK